jgi:hypothetical protein
VPSSKDAVGGEEAEMRNADEGHLVAPRWLHEAVGRLRINVASNLDIITASRGRSSSHTCARLWQCECAATPMEAHCSVVCARERCLEILPCGVDWRRVVPWSPCGQHLETRGMLRAVGSAVDGEGDGLRGEKSVFEESVDDVKHLKHHLVLSKVRVAG